MFSYYYNTDMKNKLLLSIAILSIFFLFPRPVHAIIFLPALILIPIAKIVAVLIGGLSIPVVSIGALWSRLTKKSLKRTITVIVGILLIIAALVAVILKIENPARPLF